MAKMRTLSLLLAAALSGPACALDLGGMLSAGQDLASAATLSDGDVSKLASEARGYQDRANKLAPDASQHGKRLAKVTKGLKSVDGLDLNIKAYVKDEVNAFAMADGTIRVYTGLMDKMSDDELRYVIGHEIGHVKLGHSKKALQTAYATSAVRKVAASSDNSAVANLSGSALGGLAEKLVNAQFSQSQENDADAYALDFMKQRKYDAKAAVSALRKLEQLYGNDSSAFSSHPAPGDRAKAIEAAL